MKLFENFALFSFFTLIFTNCWASQVIAPSLQEQVCLQKVIVEAEVVEVTLDDFAIQHLGQKKKYTDYYTKAQLKTLQVLKGSIETPTYFHMFFKGRSVDSPFDFGDKLFVPTKGLKAIWFVTEKDPFMGYHGNSHFHGHPIAMDQKPEIQRLIKNCR